LFVLFPDSSWTRLQLRLDPGQTWDFDLKVSGDRILDVQVLEKEDHKVGRTVLVAANEKNGVLVIRAGSTAPGGLVRFEGIRASKAQVLVMEDGGSQVASRDVDFGQESALRIEIPLDESPFRVRVVDLDRRPVAGAKVTVRSPSGADLHAVDDTDIEGQASLLGVPRGPVLLDVQHGVHGRMLGIAADASLPETEVVLDARGALELELDDAGFGLAGVAVRMETPSGVSLSDAKDTDANGLVRFGPLGEGRYRLSCRRADCWPTFVEEELMSEETARLNVQMRRLASVVFELQTRDGQSVSGVPLRLKSAEFGVDAAKWLAEEKIQAPRGLATDAQGRLGIEGLPNGPYKWSILIEGEELEGKCGLKPGDANHVLIQLP
jgi:hypothetical protein